MLLAKLIKVNVLHNHTYAHILLHVQHNTLLYVKYILMGNRSI